MAIATLETDGGLTISIVPPTLASAVELREIESSTVEKSTLANLLWPAQPDDPPSTNTDGADSTAAAKHKIQDERTVKFLEDPINQYFLVTDEATGQGVAFGWWQHAKGKTTEEWAETYKNRFKSPRMNQELSDAVNGGRILRRAVILKDMEHFTLKELFVRPEFQRRGIGARLVKWGVERADELRLPAYIEASAMGLGLYTKFGFEIVDEVTVDLEPYGGEKGDFNTYTLLFREARKI